MIDDSIVWLIIDFLKASVKSAHCNHRRPYTKICQVHVV